MGCERVIKTCDGYRFHAWLCVGHGNAGALCACMGSAGAARDA